MVLHTYGAKLKTMSLSDAFRQGYVFHVTYERLVLRTAYGQADSVATEVNVRLKTCVKHDAYLEKMAFPTDKWHSSGSVQKHRIFQKRLGHVYG